MPRMHKIRQRIPGVVEELVKSYGSPAGVLENLSGRPLPSREEVIAILDDLQEVLFPGYYGPREMTEENVRFYVGERIDRVASRLTKQCYRAFNQRCQNTKPGDCDHCHDLAETAINAFLSRLTEVRALLQTDVQAGMDGDPAATGPDEIIFCYPGLYAIYVFRTAHVLHTLGVPIIPRIMTEHAHNATGIDIHPGATIGPSFFIDHGTGVVIGETTNIGKGVRIYQGVTLGALSLSSEETKTLRGHKRHPTIEDDVVIYANATILGGNTVIGRGAMIGGNCWVTRSVPAGEKVTLCSCGG